MQLLKVLAFAAVLAVASDARAVRSKVPAGAPPAISLGSIESGINILTGSQMPAPLFEFTSELVPTSDGLYSIPASGVGYAPGGSRCSRAQASTTMSTFAELNQTVRDSVSVSGSYKWASMSLSASMQAGRQQLFKEKTVATLSAYECDFVHLSVLIGLANLSTPFLSRLRSLPTSYSASNKMLFTLFFDQFGTHAVQNVDLGGTLVAWAFTSKAYYEDNGQFAVSQQATASFLAAVHHSSSYGVNVSAAYSEATSFEGVVSTGGQPWVNTSTFAEWVGTIKADTDGPVTRTAVSLPELLTVYGLTENLATVTEAWIDYLVRPGCTDPRATNYDPTANVNTTTCNIVESFQCHSAPEWRGVRADGCIASCGQGADGTQDCWEPAAVWWCHQHGYSSVKSYTQANAPRTAYWAYGGCDGSCRAFGEICCFV